MPLLTATPTPEPLPVAEGDGYLFLIQGSSVFAIMRSQGRNLTPLVDWTRIQFDDLTICAPDQP